MAAAAKHRQRTPVCRVKQLGRHPRHRQTAVVQREVNDQLRALTVVVLTVHPCREVVAEYRTAAAALATCVLM